MKLCGYFLQIFIPQYFGNSTTLLRNECTYLHFRNLLQQWNDNLLQLDCVSSEVTDAVRKFLGRHFVLVQHPPELALGQRDFLHFLFLCGVLTQSQL